MNQTKPRSAAETSAPKPKDKTKPKDSFPTLPCCDAMRAGLYCDCCEIIDE